MNSLRKFFWTGPNLGRHCVICSDIGSVLEQRLSVTGSMKSQHQLGSVGVPGFAQFHTSVAASKYKAPTEALEGPKKWPAYNNVVLPPQLPNEPRRPAQVFHMRTQIRHSEHKLWYAAMMIRGMSIDEALRQLTLNPRKSCQIVKEVLEEAQEIAIRDHNFEFKSKMWVAESFTGKGTCVKGIRRMGKGRIGHIKYNFNHYFVKLEEGDPPAVFKDHPCDTFELKGAMQNYIEKQRKRFVWNSL
ncbi:39S ribosomal protein L22, mitochondrial-like [Paramacrobiotus metropolitanus]|uniref:39S ribosomal protein L22, mitochondrial-like n=1 Tax=Paramacrobiotus metropolitanus TaxID=2943436 RepID=UPI002445A134|nr:39S ribosomal protein L22, mitochondrial-like [Paramacrobiotus metropolitanus]